MIRGIIATHGKLGEELIRTAERIAGPQKRLDFVSNEGLSVDALAGVNAIRNIRSVAGGHAIEQAGVTGDSVAGAGEAKEPGIGVVAELNGS